MFDKTGRIYVNIGAPTDSCVGNDANRPCPAGEGPNPLAAIWAFTPPAGGIFPALKPGDPNPPREIFARGLRNSMALAVHPEFPARGLSRSCRPRTGATCPTPMKPNEELNALEKGKHYGWPYCYDLSTPSPEFAASCRRAPTRISATTATLYRQPYSLLPPHGAPLGMLYYHGGKFPELKNKLLVGLHGYRPTGSRVICLSTSTTRAFRKLQPPPVRYGVSCAAEPTRAFQTESAGQVAAAPFDRADSRMVQGQRRAAAGRAGRHDGRGRRRDLAGRGQEQDHHPHRYRAGASARVPLPCDLRSDQQIAALDQICRERRRESQRASRRSGPS